MLTNNLTLLSLRRTWSSMRKACDWRSQTLTRTRMVCCLPVVLSHYLIRSETDGCPIAYVYMLVVRNRMYKTEQL